MDIKQLERDYHTYGKDYKTLQSDVLAFVRDIDEQHAGAIDPTSNIDVN